MLRPLYTEILAANDVVKNGVVKLTSKCLNLELPNEVLVVSNVVSSVGIYLSSSPNDGYK